MILNKRVLSNLAFFVILAIVFFTPIGTWVKTKINQLVMTEPNVEDIANKETLSDDAFNLELMAYNGLKNKNLSEFKGKVIFINFWATWCPPCRAEMPSIQQLYDEKGDQIAFVMIAMQDKPEKFLPYLKDNQFTFPVYEANSLLHQSLKPDSFPTTLIINKKGEIVLKETGAADWDSPAIHELLDEIIRQP